MTDQQHQDPKIISDWRQYGPGDGQSCIVMADTDSTTLPYALRNSLDPVPEHVMFTNATDFRGAAANANILLGAGEGGSPLS